MQSNDKQDSFLSTDSEYLLAHSKCQSRIDGRNGSNACIVIAVCVCQKVLSETKLPSLPQENTFLRSAGFEMTS